jgi:hypothetical protein
MAGVAAAGGAAMGLDDAEHAHMLTALRQAGSLCITPLTPAMPAQLSCCLYQHVF